MSKTKHCYLHGPYDPVNGGCLICEGMISSPKDLVLLELNQIWWVKLPRKESLVRRKVIKLSDCTVTLLGLAQYVNEALRYKTTDVEFVELTENQNAENIHNRS